MDSSILSKVLLLLGVCLLETPLFVLGTGISVDQFASLPDSVICRAPLTPQQQRRREKDTREQQEAKNKPLVGYARTGDFRSVQAICKQTPKKWPQYCYSAFREAVLAGHNEIAEYLVYRLGLADRDGNPMCCRFFWESILYDEPVLFDFFIAHGIDVHYISKGVFYICDGEIYYFRGFHVNPESFLRTAFCARGWSEGLQHMLDVLRSRGVLDTPPASYSGGGGGGCCEVY
jgi:hypothetical protein